MTLSPADLADASASQLLALYRAGQASPVEATRAVLARIARLNPVLNAFCLVDEEAALASARASEARWRTGQSGGPPSQPSYAAPNPAGFYSGVSVQGNHVPPFPAKQTGAPPVVLTWTGFERAPEGSRVFFELSAEGAYEVTNDGLTLRIRLRNTKVNVRNNTRYLDLRYFKTPVRTVKVTRKGRDTLATVVLKRDAVPNVQVIDGKAGYKLLVVQFSDAESPELDADGPFTVP